MGLRDNYKGYLFTVQADSVRRAGNDGVSVTGTVCYVLAGNWVVAAMSDYVRQWDEQRSYKIGLKLRRIQEVRAAYRRADGGGEIRLREDPAVTAELRDLFPPEAGHEWVGLVPEDKGLRWHRFEEPNTVYFELSITVRPMDDKPQLIPFVARHANGSFADGHMTGLWELPPPPST
jgi:hypothetical protein